MNGELRCPLGIDRTRRWRGVALAMLCLAAGCKREPPGGSLLHPVYREARASIFALGGEAAGIQGTAFVLRIGAERHLVTSFHVVSKVERPVLENEDGVRIRGIEVLRVDRAADVAILRAPMLPASARGLVPSEDYGTSQAVYLMGYPAMSFKESHLNFASGVISDRRYRAPVLIGGGEIDYIQATTPVNLGHSGSPLLDERARAIGVIAWRYEPNGEIQAGNYAVPIRQALRLIEARQDPVAEALHDAAHPACASDAGCAGMDFCLDGRCQELRRIGGRCSVDDDCYLPLVCLEQRCTEPAQEGAPCADDATCRPPGFCVLGTCQPLGSVGAGCAVDRDCVAPLVCDQGVCSKGRSKASNPRAPGIPEASPPDCPPCAQ